MSTQDAVQEAEIQLTEVVRLLETFDNTANEVIKMRVHLELFAADTTYAKSQGVDINEQKSNYRQLKHKLGRLGDHIKRQHDSLDTLRRKAARAQIISEMLGALENAIMKKRAYLDMYKLSNTLPSESTNEEVFNMDLEEARLLDSEKQRDALKGEFIEAVKEIALGEPSNLVIPDVEKIQMVN